MTEHYTPFAGGTSFTKTWTIKNTGTSTWTSSYKLRYVSNTAGRMSTVSEVAISGSVAPGGTYKFSVPMKAPAAQSSEKSYKEVWKFTNPAGSTINIGSSATVWALIKVPAPLPPSSDYFTWPVDPTNRTDGHYTGTSSAKTIEFWLHNSNHIQDTVWRDAQPFQKYYYSTYGYHLGSDFNIKSGDSDLNLSVYPIAKGTVSRVLENVCGYGNIVFVKHTTSFGARTYTSMYAHVNWLSSGKPVVNTSVSSANPIARIGKGAWTKTSSCGTSGSYPAHLHFEIRRGDRTEPGAAYTKSKCDGSDSSTNNCPQNQIDPDIFISAHN
ncbi:MAG: NBR1-Ig-like domain-containing protein [Desulfococcaceae bacterium]